MIKNLSKFFSKILQKEQGLSSQLIQAGGLDVYVELVKFPFLGLFGMKENKIF